MAVSPKDFYGNPGYWGTSVEQMIREYGRRRAEIDAAQRRNLRAVQMAAQAQYKITYEQARAAGITLPDDKLLLLEDL